MYTKNRLSSFSPPQNSVDLVSFAYSSPPPYEDGWMWIVEPSGDNINYGSSIQCGDDVVLKSSINNHYIEAINNDGNVSIGVSNEILGESSQWTVICRTPPYWDTDQQVQLKNSKYGCYLQTSFENEFPDDENKYSVNCSSLSKASVWIVTEGAIFGDSIKDEKPNTDEL